LTGVRRSAWHQKTHKIEFNASIPEKIHLIFRVPSQSGIRIAGHGCVWGDIASGLERTNDDNQDPAHNVYAYSKTLGAGDAYSGAGALGGATAIGNSLSVVVNGSYNTVIVHNNQTNNGNVTATANGSTATGAKGTDITGDLQF